MNGRKILYDDTGTPIKRDGDTVDDLNLPPGVQALIETRINAALDQIRSVNQVELQRLSGEHAKKWKIIAVWSVVAVVLAIAWEAFSWFIAPAQIQAWISEQVTQRVTEPALKASIDETMRSESSRYIDHKIEPLRSRANSLAKTIDTLGAEIGTKQKQLESHQETIRVQVKARQLSVGSRAGSLRDYRELQSLANGNTEAKTSADAELKDIELHFDLDRRQIFYSRIVDGISKQDAGQSVDELVSIVTQRNDELREAAINSIADLKSKSVVQFLCELLPQEQNLRVISRITRALEEITKEQFRPLDIEAVEAWWQANKTRSEFACDYGAYVKAEHMIQGKTATPSVSLVLPSVSIGAGNTEEFALMIDPSNSQEVIALLDKTIAGEPKALHARCLRCLMLIVSGKSSEAEVELKEVEKYQGDYRWLFFYRALRLAEESKDAEAASYLSRALAKSPALETHARKLAAFRILASHPQMKWPSADQSSKKD